MFSKYFEAYHGHHQIDLIITIFKFVHYVQGIVLNAFLLLSNQIIPTTQFSSPSQLIWPPFP